LRVVKANEAFYKAFQVAATETEGKFVYELGNGQWNIPRLRSLLEQVLPNQTRILDFPVEHTFPDLGLRRMLLNARRMNADETEKETILLAIQDVTETTKA
jgi:two-component system CheB/CheR fusion protein